MNRLRSRSRPSVLPPSPVSGTTAAPASAPPGAAETASASSPSTTAAASSSSASPAPNVQFSSASDGDITVSKTRSSSTTSAAFAEGIQRRRSLKADNLAVALSGGTTKSKTGTLKKKNSTIFGTTYKASYVKVDNGDIVFAMTEDDLSYDDEEDNNSKIKKYSLFEIRELKLVPSNSSEFMIKLGSPDSKPKTVVLKAESPEDAVEWIETLKHEIKNQVLVCKSMAQVLSEKGKPERAEPLFQQSVEALSVAFGPNHAEVGEAMMSYAIWLETQNRLEEAISMKTQAQMIITSSLEDSETVKSSVGGKISEASDGTAATITEGAEAQAEPRSRTKSWRLLAPPRSRSVSFGRSPAS